MIDKGIKDSAAEILLKIGAVNIADEPCFKLTSGRMSPVYVDCRKITGFYQSCSYLMDCAADLAKKIDKQNAFDIVAGGETAGIAYAALVADRLQKPMSYIRKKPKGHGLSRLIEGAEIKKDHKVLLVEDMATDGLSKQHFAAAIRKEGAKCDDCLVIFYYNIFDLAVDLNIHYLTDLETIKDVGISKGVLTGAQVSALSKFLDDVKGEKN